MDKLHRIKRNGQRRGKISRAPNLTGCSFWDPLCPEERHPAEDTAQGPQATLSRAEEGKLFHVGSQSSSLSQSVHQRGCLLVICPKLLLS